MIRAERQGPHLRGRGKIRPVRRVFNAALALLLLLPAACKKGEEATDAGPKDAAKPAPPPPSVPASAEAFLGPLPELPLDLGLHLGDPAEAVRKARPQAEPSPLTPALLIEDLPADGPFRMATYLLTRPAADKLETLILTLRPEYGHAVHFQAMQAAIEAKLGKGKAVEHEGFTGLEWALPGQRLELRRDTRRADEPELVFDLRGARQIEMP